MAAFVRAAVPFVPFATILKVSGSPSGSLAAGVPVPGVSSSVVSAPLAATGASLTGVIVTVKVAMFESSAASCALNVKVSVPLALAFGV